MRTNVFVRGTKYHIFPRQRNEKKFCTFYNKIPPKRAEFSILSCRKKEIKRPRGAGCKALRLLLRVLQATQNFLVCGTELIIVNLRHGDPAQVAVFQKLRRSFNDLGLENR